MKTAVSIPDDVFRKGEEFVRRVGGSRSSLYGRALAEYIARHAPDRVTEAMDRALDGLQDPADPFVAMAARRALSHNDW